MRRADALARIAAMDDSQAEGMLEASVAAADDTLARNPYLWALQTMTQDEADSGKVKPFPRDPYIEDAFAVLCSGERKIAIPKSRRMKATWTVAAYVTHRARYQPGTAVFWQADNEDKAAFVVQERCRFMERSLRPELRRPFATIRTSKGMVGRINYLGRGYVWGVPQGDSALRTYTPTILVMDEADFQAEANQSLAAALPFAEKEAQIILITTSNGPSGPVAQIAKSCGFLSFPASGR